MAGADESEGMLKPADSPTDILAPVFANTNLSLLDMVKLQARCAFLYSKPFGTS